MTLFGREIAGRVIGMVVGVIVLIVAVSIILSQCSSGKRAKTQNRVNEGAAGAAIDSGVVAVETASNIVASDAATDAQVAAAQAEIAAAAKGQKGKAAKRAACRFKAYRDTSQCSTITGSAK
jgi:hypothetical protein